jgi:hypothetical protein
MERDAHRDRERRQKMKRSKTNAKLRIESSRAFYFLRSLPAIYKWQRLMKILLNGYSATRELTIVIAGQVSQIGCNLGTAFTGSVVKLAQENLRL